MQQHNPFLPRRARVVGWAERGRRDAQQLYVATADERPIQLSSPSKLVPPSEVSAVAIDNPGVGQTPGVYNIVGVGGAPTTAAHIQVTVNGDGTVHAGGVVVTNPGSGYAGAAPTFTMPGGAGGAPPASFTATISSSTNTTLVMLTYRVPAGHVLVIEQAAIVNVGNADVDFSDNAVWSITRNGVGIQGYAALQAQLGSLATPQKVDLNFGQNETVQVILFVQGGGYPAGNTPACRLIGYLRLAPPRNNLLTRGA
jgi:hypothetical protein